MKRVLFLLLIAFVAIAGNAKEKIKIDKMKDGYRIIQTERTAHVFPSRKL